jgi:hypothetical protein
MYSISIELARTHFRQIHMPDLIGSFFKSNPVGFLILEFIGK